MTKIKLPKTASIISNYFKQKYLKGEFKNAVKLIKENDIEYIIFDDKSSVLRDGNDLNNLPVREWKEAFPNTDFTDNDLDIMYRDELRKTIRRSKIKNLSTIKWLKTIKRGCLVIPLIWKEKTMQKYFDMIKSGLNQQIENIHVKLKSDPLLLSAIDIAMLQVEIAEAQFKLDLMTDKNEGGA